MRWGGDSKWKRIETNFSRLYILSINKNSLSSQLFEFLFLPALVTVLLKLEEKKKLLLFKELDKYV